MLFRIIKTIIFGAVVYYGARKVTDNTKLLATRAAAKTEMDRLDALMKDIFLMRNEFANMPDNQRMDLFDRYLDQSKRVTKIYSKTF